MDQVRNILGWLKRQHFWVLCGLAAVIALFCWWSAARTLYAKYDTNAKTIKTQFDGLKSVRDAAFHANEAIIERQEAEKKKQADSVAALWEALYKKQRDQVLKWPDVLGKAFRDAVEKMQFGDEIPNELRNNYQNYIERHFPELPKQINARVLDVSTPGMGGEGYGRGAAPGFGPEGMAGANGLMPDDGDYICDWAFSDQAVIRQELDFPERPSALRIWVVQEDLWVYHTLLDVIAKTNQQANATRMANAAVKIVFNMQVGKYAAPFSREKGRLLVQPQVATAVPGAEGAPGMTGPEGGGRGGAGPEGGRGGPGMMPGQMFGAEGGMRGGPVSPAQEQNDLLSYRYLDDKGAPIAVGAAAAAGGGEAAPAPEAAPDLSAPAPPIDLAQFGPGYKRLPVRMLLRMDTRYLPQFITNCANEPLRIEVQEVRIGTSDIAGLDQNGGGGAMMMSRGGFEGGGGRGGFGGGAMGASLFTDRAGIQYFPAQPHVANVVVQGTIYIFNKPNLKLLEEPPASAGGGATVAAQ
jgi:hypothetical protein